MAKICFHSELYIIHNTHTYLQSGGGRGRTGGGSWWFRGGRDNGRSGSPFNRHPDVHQF